MGNIIELCNQFKTDVEKNQFLVKQHETILSLTNENKRLIEEVEHLKTLLVASAPILNPTTRVILTPEEALIEQQIELIQNRSYNAELTLEDVKKLDLLLKNKKLSKEQNVSLQGESKKVDKKNYTNAELILLASSKSPEGT